MVNTSLMDLKINNTPAEFANKIRQRGEVFWSDLGNFWVITKHEYAKKILTSSDFTCDRSAFFISRMPNLDLSLIQDFFAVVGKMMVMSDPPVHTARRRICYHGFTNKFLQGLKPLITKRVDQIVTKAIKNKRIEIVEDLAKIIPSTTLAEFFDIPEQERSLFYEWSNNMTQFFGGASQYRNEDGVVVNNSAASLREYFSDLVKQRRKKPHDDFLSILLAQQDHFGLSDDEIISQAIMMLVAGQITTTDQICNNLFILLNNPEILLQLKNNLGQLDVALEELNRLDPAVTFIFRVTKNATTIGDKKIKAGDVIFISTHAINRDPEIFEHPNQCLLTRPNNLHCSYGFGGHYCLGAKLARLEMQIIFTALLKNPPNLRLDPKNPPKRKHHSLAFSGFETLACLIN